MEFVVVRFSESRQVYINGNPSGFTNDTLEVEEGHHRFTLEGPMNYQPESIEVAVGETTVISPLEITFNSVASEPADTPPSISTEEEPPNV